MKKTFAELCLERAEKAVRVPDGYAIVIDVIKDDTKFIAASREMVPELCRRLKRACGRLRELSCKRRDDEFIDELEAMPEEK